MMSERKEAVMAVVLSRDELLGRGLTKEADARGWAGVLVEWKGWSSKQVGHQHCL